MMGKSCFVGPPAVYESPGQLAMILHSHEKVGPTLSMSFWHLNCSQGGFGCDGKFMFYRTICCLGDSWSTS